MNENYLGNPNLFKANTKQEYTEDQIREIAKCMEDPIYFISNYIKIVNIDEGLGLTDVVFDTTGQQLIRDTTRAHFYGGGGVGVQGNPVVGVDGSLMSVDVVHPGFGYQYPPLVAIEDDRGVGSGAVAIAVLSDKTEGTEELYNQEEDFDDLLERFQNLSCQGVSSIFYSTHKLQSYALLRKDLSLNFQVLY